MSENKEAMDALYESALEAFETSFNEAAVEYINAGGDLEEASIAVTVEIATEGGEDEEADGEA